MEAVESAEWEWRFVGAFARMLTDGTIDLLTAAAADADNPAHRAAAAAVVAAAYLGRAQAEGAIEILETAISFDDAEPVDMDGNSEAVAYQESRADREFCRSLTEFRLPYLSNCARCKVSCLCPGWRSLV
jgi:hypothetical protein